MTKLKTAMMTLALAGLMTASPARARNVLLNGVNLNSVELPAVTLRGCTVHIDAKGNIHITARGYKIQVDGKTGDRTPVPRRTTNTTTTTSSVKTVGRSTDRYFLVSFFNKKAATQYDIELFINGKLIRRVRAHHDQVAQDITQHIRRGKPNEIIFVSRKTYGGKSRMSASPMDYFRVVLGGGFESKGQIVLKRSLVETRRTAAETQSVYTEKQTLIFR